MHYHALSCVATLYVYILSFLLQPTRNMAEDDTEADKSMSPDKPENEEEIDQVALETKEQQYPSIIMPHAAPGWLS